MTFNYVLTRNFPNPVLGPVKPETAGSPPLERAHDIASDAAIDSPRGDGSTESKRSGGRHKPSELSPQRAIAPHFAGFSETSLLMMNIIGNIIREKNQAANLFTQSRRLPNLLTKLGI